MNTSSRSSSCDVRQRDLTLRDQRILSDLVEFRYLTTRQIARLHFGHPKLAQRRLRNLLAQGSVVRIQSENAARAGFHEWTYALAPRHAKADLDGQGALHDPSRGIGLRYAAHHRLVTDVRIWLREGADRSAGRFSCRFVPSYAEARVGGTRRRLIGIDTLTPDGVLVPDGVFALRCRDGRAALFFLEADRGSEPLRGKHPSSILRKFTMYRTVFDHRLFQPFAEFLAYDFSGFRVLVVAPDKQRADRMLEVAAAADVAPLVWTSTAAILEERGNLGAAVWRDTRDGRGRALTE
jgi:Replication-relaxation